MSTVLNEAVASVQRTRAVYGQFVQAFNYGQTDVLKEIVPDDFVHHPFDRGSPKTVVRKPDLMRIAQQRLDTGNGPRTQIIDCVAEGDRVVDWSADWPGKRCFAFRFVNGKVASTVEVAPWESSGTT